MKARTMKNYETVRTRERNISQHSMIVREDIF